MARTVEGMLPVCAGCESVRDADLGWIPLDRFVRQETGVEFPPALFQDCVTSLCGTFPDLATGATDRGSKPRCTRSPLPGVS
jgi:hypothetical protein